MSRNGRAGAARRVIATVSVLAPALACSAVGGLGDGCQIVQSPTALPAGLQESSGVAASRDHAGVLWTHNDSGGDAEVVAVQANGQLVGRVAVQGATARDWEDIELASCPAGTCLYIADTGDGGGGGREVTVYRAPEPDPVTQTAVTADRFPARFPEGRPDAEALFVLPSGEIYLITKGKGASIELFRYPLPLREGETAALEPVRTLAAGPQSLEDQVTGASASPSGEWVAVRSYKRLQLWRTPDLLGTGVPSLSVDLSPLGEVQGEAVALLDNGGVVLTSEGGFPGVMGTVAVAHCELPE